MSSYYYSKYYSIANNVGYYTSYKNPYSGYNKIPNHQAVSVSAAPKPAMKQPLPPPPFKIHAQFWTEEIRSYFAAYEKYLIQKKFHFIGYGASRRTLGREDIVIKIPYCNGGLMDNVIEAWGYNKYRNNPTPDKKQLLAPCRLLSNHCLMMKKVDVDPDRDRKARPAWVNNMDGIQAGKYKEQWVAYDYAHDLNYERTQMWPYFHNGAKHEWCRL